MPEAAATSAVATAIVGAEWTIGSLAVHMAELRAADIRYNDTVRRSNFAFETERDRRYAEVNVEKEKALKIKETADLAALTLAREIQSYKDANADKLREQGLRETGAYVTHDDLANVITKFESLVTPALDYINSQKGVMQGSQMTTGRMFGYIAAGGTIMAIVSGLITMVVSFIQHAN